MISLWTGAYVPPTAVEPGAGADVLYQWLDREYPGSSVIEELTLERRSESVAVLSFVATPGNAAIGVVPAAVLAAYDEAVWLEQRTADL